MQYLLWECMCNAKGRLVLKAVNTWCVLIKPKYDQDTRKRIHPSFQEHTTRVCHCTTWDLIFWKVKLMHQMLLYAACTRDNLLCLFSLAIMYVQFKSGSYEMVRILLLQKLDTLTVLQMKLYIIFTQKMLQYISSDILITLAVNITQRMQRIFVCFSFKLQTYFLICINFCLLL